MNNEYVYFNDFKMNPQRDPHYKLYARVRESIVFEAALTEAEIDFIKEEIPLDEYIRYYFKDEDSQKINRINEALKLSLSTETIPSLDLAMAKKNLIVYLIVILIMAVIILIIAKI